MRKATKWATILGAAAVMTFGACMTSFAATGWVEEGGEWYYYDQYEEASTAKWIKSNATGKYFYVGDDGAMVTSSWVDDGENKYFVNASGERCVNEWRYMFGYDDDADEESWFYFGSTGKMATKKTTINGKVYYFNTDGKMLTGWVFASGDTVEVLDSEIAGDMDVYYCDENGERVTSAWKKLYAPEDEDEEDQYWYYFASSGKVHKDTKKTINGKSYLFAQNGQMLSGWVLYDDSTSPSNGKYVSIPEDEGEKTGVAKDLLYAGSSDDGSLRKNKWFKVAAPGTENDDADVDKFWYYAGTNGQLTYGSSDLFQVAKVDTGSKLPNADAPLDAAAKKINGKYYVFDSNGKMKSGLVYITNEANSGVSGYPEGLYYFSKGDEGWLKTGSVTLTNDDDESFGYYFSSKTSERGQGVTGIQGNKLYIGGILITAAEDTKVQPVEVAAGVPNVGGNTYLISENGTIRSGVQTDDNGVKYKADKVSGSNPANYKIFVYDETQKKYVDFDDFGTPIN